MEMKKVRLEHELPLFSPHCKRFLAHQAVLDRKVEFRMPPPDADAAAIETFEAELEDLLELDHPAFLAVLDSGVTKDRPFYTVGHRDYLPFARLMKDGKLGVQDAYLAVRSLADGFAEAHKKGIFLGPPSPITLHWDAEAKQLRYVHHRFAAAVKCLGLPAGAPEALRNGPPSGPSDVFHWAQFAYWVLSPGKQPEVGAPGQGLREHQPLVDPELNSLLRACLDRTPELRPAHMGEVQAVLGTIGAPLLEEAAGPAQVDVDDAAAHVADSIRELKIAGLVQELGQRSGKVQRKKPTTKVEVESPEEEAAAHHLKLAGAGLACLVMYGLFFSSPAPSRPPPPTRVATPRATRAAQPASAYQKDPYVNLLLRLEAVTPNDFARVHRIVTRLSDKKRLPAAVDDPDRIAAIRETHKRDRARGVEDLNRLLDDLRKAVGQGGGEGDDAEP